MLILELSLNVHNGVYQNNDIITNNNSLNERFSDLLLFDFFPCLTQRNIPIKQPVCFILICHSDPSRIQSSNPHMLLLQCYTWSIWRWRSCTVSPDTLHSHVGPDADRTPWVRAPDSTSYFLPLLSSLLVFTCGRAEQKTKIIRNIRGGHKSSPPPLSFLTTK